MMEREQLHKLSISILEHSNDGDDLAGSDLALVQGAVNGELSTRGEVVLYQLNHRVVEGTYEIPAFCGVDNLTRNNEGFVFWKGKQIEHYDHDHWAQPGWEKEMQKDAEELGRVCQYLDDNGIKVTFNNYLDNRSKV